MSLCEWQTPCIHSKRVPRLVVMSLRGRKQCQGKWQSKVAVPLCHDTSTSTNGGSLVRFVTLPINLPLFIIISIPGKGFMLHLPCGGCIMYQWWRLALRMSMGCSLKGESDWESPEELFDLPFCDSMNKIIFFPSPVVIATTSFRILLMVFDDPHNISIPPIVRKVSPFSL